MYFYILHTPLGHVSRKYSRRIIAKGFQGVQNNHSSPVMYENLVQAWTGFQAPTK